MNKEDCNKEAFGTFAFLSYVSVFSYLVGGVVLDVLRY